MEWILTTLSSVGVLGLILWLSRNLITTRLTNSVRHEYDEKIANLNSELRKSEEVFRADLRLKESQIDALRKGALSGIANRQSALFEKQLEAVDMLWDAVVSFAPAKSIAQLIAGFKFDAMSKVAAKDQRVRDMFSSLKFPTIKEMRTEQAIKSRPYLSPLSWAYYSAYQAIVLHALLRLEVLKSGIDIEGVVDSEAVVKLVQVALPHRVDYIEKFGVDSLHYLFDELEIKLLDSFKLAFDGEALDKAGLAQAAEIIKQSEILASTK